MAMANQEHLGGVFVVTPELVSQVSVVPRGQVGIIFCAVHTGNTGLKTSPHRGEKFITFCRMVDVLCKFIF